jgi:hypothetical protein
MKPINPDKLERIGRAIRQLIVELQQINSLKAHQRIDESYYLEKAEELELLTEQLHNAHRVLETVRARACLHYKDIYDMWRKDIRWLRAYRRGCTVL